MFHKNKHMVTSLGWIERTRSFDSLHLQYEFAGVLEKQNTMCTQSAYPLAMVLFWNLAPEQCCQKKQLLCFQTANIL